MLLIYIFMVLDMLKFGKGINEKITASKLGRRDISTLWYYSILVLENEGVHIESI